VEPPVTVSDVILGCYNCHKLVVYGSEQCPSCHIEFSVEFWREYAGIRDAVEERYNDINPLELDYDTRLCCNQMPEQCDCIHPIDWDETFDVPSDVNDKVFSTDHNNVCNFCFYMWTYQCVPYRNWIFDFLLTGEISAPITGCANFKDYEETNV
jgi:hypothetical protein